MKILLMRERASMHACLSRGRCRKGARGTESPTDSVLNMKPHEGLNLMALRSGPRQKLRVRCLTESARHPSLHVFNQAVAKTDTISKAIISLVLVSLLNF